MRIYRFILFSLIQASLFYSAGRVSAQWVKSDMMTMSSWVNNGERYRVESYSLKDSFLFVIKFEDFESPGQISVDTFYGSFPNNPEYQFVLEDIQVLNRSELLMCLYDRSNTGEGGKKRYFYKLNRTHQTRLVHVLDYGYFESSKCPFYFIDSLHGFYLGNYDLTRKCMFVLQTSDAGESWQQLDAGNSLPLSLEPRYSFKITHNYSQFDYLRDRISDFGSYGYVLVRQAQNSGKFVLKWSDSTNKWISVKSELMNSQDYYLLDFIAFDSLNWIILRWDHEFRNKELWRTSDGGLYWEKIQMNFFEEGLQDLYTIDINDGFFQNAVFLEVMSEDRRSFSSFMSLDQGKSFFLLDEYVFPINEQVDYAYLSFYNNKQGIRRLWSTYRTGNQKSFERIFRFDLDKAIAKSFQQIENQKFLCRMDSLSYALDLPVPVYWSLHSDGRDTFQVGMPLRITPSQSMEVYLFSPYHSDTLEIILREPFPEEELEKSYSVCSDSSLEIDLSHLPFAGFSWSNGQRGAVFQSNVAGNYMLQVEADHYCAGDYPFSISNYPVRSSEKDTAICPDNIDGIPINFEPELKALGWIAPSSLTALPEFKEEKDLAYTLIDTNACPAFIQWHVFTTCPPEFYLPNAFHPGGPIEANQHFQPVSRYVDSFHLVIYNRWGQQVYSGTQLNQGWNGTYAGKEAESGMYFYRIVFTYTKEPHLQERKNLEGKLYLMR